MHRGESEVAVSYNVAITDDLRRPGSTLKAFSVCSALLVALAMFSKVEVLGQESSFILAAGGRVTTVEPAGLLSVAKEGQWALDSTDHVVKLDYTRWDNQLCHTCRSEKHLLYIQDNAAFVNTRMIKVPHLSSTGIKRLPRKPQDTSGSRMYIYFLLYIESFPWYGEIATTHAYNKQTPFRLSACNWRRLTSTKWVGLVDVGGGQENLEVLAVDDKLLVASETRRLASANGAEATQTGAVKYRLLLRQ